MSKKKLTQERLKELLHYDKSTGIFTWLTTKSHKVNPGDTAGARPKSKNQYIYISIDGASYSSHRLAWFYEYGYFPENDIDHKDRIKCHNWINNLREVTRSCNMRNVCIRNNNISGITGVCFIKPRNKYLSQITVNSKTIYLGIFVEFNDAVKARHEAEKKYNWDNCNSSSSSYLYLNERGLV